MWASGGRADTRDLKSLIRNGYEGSNPSSPTKEKNNMDYIIFNIDSYEIVDYAESEEVAWKRIGQLDSFYCVHATPRLVEYFIANGNPESWDIFFGMADLISTV